MRRPSRNERRKIWEVDFQAGLGFSVESTPRQVLLEFRRDWTRHETYEAARAIVVADGGGYGMGLAYAREVIHPG
ncbi:MAG TPA: hypothetical protein VIV65_10510 [Gemmatimonadaceae bacterium]|jgi:hypothetical protein